MLFLPTGLDASHHPSVDLGGQPTVVPTAFIQLEGLRKQTTGDKSVDMRTAYPDAGANFIESQNAIGFRQIRRGVVICHCGYSVCRWSRHSAAQANWAVGSQKLLSALFTILDADDRNVGFFRYTGCNTVNAGE